MTGSAPSPRRLRLLPRIRLAVLAVLAMAAAAAPAARAHNLSYVAARAEIAEDRSVRVSLNMHVAAFLMGEPPAHLSDEARARWAALPDAELAALIEAGEQALREALEIAGDGEPAVIDEITFPEMDVLRADGLVPPEDARPSAPLVIEARLAATARTFTFAPPLGFSETLLSVGDWRGARVLQSIAEGERSQPFLIGGDEAAAPAATAWMGSVGEFTRLGFVHILPLGLDHILFVLALFFLNPAWRPLAFQVTAFTVAHTATLALGVFDLVRAPPAVVEPLIALSIAAAALDNLRSRTMAPWRPVMVFGFGLLHGLGFAGVLKQLGLPRGEEAVALLSFNVGVELGQLAVLAGAFLLVGWWVRRDWFRTRIAVPASLAIAAFGLWWTVERVAANL